MNPIHLWFPHDLLSKKDLAEKRQCLPRFHWHVLLISSGYPELKPWPLQGASWPFPTMEDWPEVMEMKSRWDMAAPPCTLCHWKCKVNFHTNTKGTPIRKKTLQISTAPHYALNIHHVIKSYNLLQSSTNQRKHHHCFSISKKKLPSTTSQTTSQHLLSKLNRLSCWYCQGARLRTSYFTICFGGAHPAKVIRFGSPTCRPLRSKPRQTPAKDFRQMALLVLKRRSRWPKQIRSHCKISAASIRSHY